MRLGRLIYSVFLLPTGGSFVNSFGGIDQQQPLAYHATFEGINAPNCPVKGPLSCQNKTTVPDTCCYDDALFLSTQFWNYYPAIGPNDTFTLHGLWPDNCDGSYEQFCDNSMNIQNVTEILQDFGEHELLAKMQKIWLNLNHNDESLWLHEWNKHATCISTIKKSCYKSFDDHYVDHKNVVDFFKITVNLYDRLPTFQWLAEAGIVPSTEATYTRKQIEDALSSKFGAVPFVKCNKYKGIQEIWYFHSSKGSLLQQDFVAIESLVKGNCPQEGIKFYPKGSLGKEPPSNGRQKRGYIKLDKQDGCLIRNGKWYIGGSCATYFLQDAPFGGHNLKSRAGYCGLSKTDGSLVCNKRVAPLQFQYNKESGVLSLNGKSQWSAENVPKKYKQANVYPGDGELVKFQLKFEQQ